MCPTASGPTPHMVLVLTEYHGTGTRLTAQPSTVVFTQTGAEYRGTHANSTPSNLMYLGF